jgi:hypothetical protein
MWGEDSRDEGEFLLFDEGGQAAATLSEQGRACKLTSLSIRLMHKMTSRGQDGLTPEAALAIIGA